jgi:hypothetical protein
MPAFLLASPQRLNFPAWFQMSVLAEFFGNPGRQYISPIAEALMTEKLVVEFVTARDEIADVEPGADLRASAAEVSGEFHFL